MFLSALMLWGACATASLTDSILPAELSMRLLFQDFMRQFNKTYRDQGEANHRFGVFVQNLKESHELQASELGTARYGVTQFSDLTETEFAKMFGMSHPSPPRRTPTLRLSDKASKEKMPPSCDWRKSGAVPAVKYQGEECKSCWAFASVSNIEALWNIHRHSPRNLSVQEVVDCTYSRKGCDGGFVWDGLQGVFNRSGLSNDALYPYAGKNQPCQKYQKRKVTQIDGYEMLPRDEQYIATFVASQGPVTALLNMKILQQYQKGIIRRPSQDCSSKHLDHAVIIVGYGEVKSRRGSWTGPYWIIQNSWGEHWGEKGYFRLHRGANTCGIAMYPTTATVKDSTGKKPVICPL